MAMIASAKSSRVRSGFYEPDRDCQRKFNYSNGAGWRTQNKGKINFKIRTFDKGTGRSAYYR
ncbi:MAG: hypothetical protein ACXABY_06035 [Candidatus Thorarchaeota archaeon]